MARPPAVVWVDEDDLWNEVANSLGTRLIVSVDPFFEAALAAGKIRTRQGERGKEFHLPDARKWLSGRPNGRQAESPPVPYGEFYAWYIKRAADLTARGERSSREQDRNDAIDHFGCDIPTGYVKDARSSLPRSHLFRRRGRPRE